MFGAALKKGPFGVILLIAFFLILGLILGSNYLVNESAKPYLVQSLDRLPHASVGLVLGCSPIIQSGGSNPFFVYRLEAAARLFKSGKVDHLLLSGDNHSRDYDEPTAMQKVLIQMGVPAEAMTLDYAGFRTLDSVLRAEKVFGLTHFTVISQRDHALRAVFIARHFGLDVYAFPAQEFGVSYAPSAHLREAFSRVKVLFDLSIFHRSPKYLGKLEPIVVTKNDSPKI